MPVDALPAAVNLFPANPANSIRNWNILNSVNGALPSPGRYPDNWFDQSNTPNAGCTITILGTGTDVTNNVKYIDIRIQGNPTASSLRIALEQYQIIPAVVDQWFLAAIWLALIAGTLTNVPQVRLNIAFRDSVGTGQSGGTGNNITPNATLTRTATVTKAVSTPTATAVPEIGVSFTTFNGTVATDLTLRIGYPAVVAAANANNGFPFLSTNLPAANSLAISSPVLGQPYIYKDVLPAPLSIFPAVPSTKVPNFRGTGSTNGVIGSGGAMPSGWSVSGSGLQFQVMGHGVDTTLNIEYTDLRYFGNPSTTGTRLSVTGNTVIACPYDRRYQTGFYIAVLAAGTGLTNVGQHQLCPQYRNSIGSSVFTGVTNFGPPDSTLRLYSGVTRAFGGSNPTTIAFADPEFQFGTTPGSAIDVTYRIGYPIGTLAAEANLGFPLLSTNLPAANTLAISSPVFGQPTLTQFQVLAALSFVLSSPVLGIAVFGLVGQRFDRGASRTRPLTPSDRRPGMPTDRRPASRAYG